MTAPSTRARPLPVEDRQAMIIGAVIPLLLERGRDVTSKQIAEAAGIAEGTIFRAFGDKETLIAAAVDAFLDPEALRTALRAIDADFPLDDKLRAIVGLMRDRFSGVIRMMAAMGTHGPPPGPNMRQEFAAILVGLLAPHQAELNLDAERVANFVRLIAFASAIPQFSDSIGFSNDELTQLLKFGVIGRPTPTPAKD